MRLREPATLAGAALAFVLIVALFSPLLDPARLAVADQVARLERGAVAPDRFDYRFLRFESGKAGQAALDRLTRSSDPEVARLAAAMKARTQRWDPTDDLADGKPRIVPWPAGTVIPDSFVDAPVKLGDARAGCLPQAECVAALEDLDGDGRAEILLAFRHSIEVFQGQADGTWRTAGYYDVPGCAGDAPSVLRRDGLARQPAPWPRLTIGGVSMDIRSESRGCPSSEPAPPRVVIPPSHR